MEPSTVGVLAGIRVVEIADEKAEYAGMLLAGMGAEVVKVEPPGGNSTRTIGPFAGDVDDKDRSLFYWHYNRGKRAVVLDLENVEGQRQLSGLLASADVLLESTPAGYLATAGFDSSALRRDFPSLIWARMTPFGDDGPWSSFKGSDLVHLALGGVVMNCGYDPDPAGDYDLPPVAPQMWQAYHIAGDQLCIGILAALVCRQRSGFAQQVSCAVHEAVAKATELDLMYWVMRHIEVQRQTCRHAAEAPTSTTIASTKDGRWFTCFPAPAKLGPFLAKYGIGDLDDDKAGEQGVEVRGFLTRQIPGSAAESEAVSRASDLLQRFARKLTYARLPWLEGQAEGLLCSPLRLPHENAEDEHWRARGTFAEIDHPDAGIAVTYPVSRWRSTEPSWVLPRCAPSLAAAVRARADLPALSALRATGAVAPGPAGHQPPATVPERKLLDAGENGSLSARGTPFALNGIRILDFSWFLASSGGTRFLSALGAETLKVEWKGNPDTRGGADAPIGGRAARMRASGPLAPDEDPNKGGQFNNKNAGKYGISLNVRHPKGLEIARRLVEISDIVAEGFSPGVMDRLGLGYGELRKLNPRIIYAQQSGMGAFGTYGRLRIVGPVANAFTGMSEMSGASSPAMPAGWGYSYLDWIGAYNFAEAILTALYHRDRTGQGCWIDASQCEAGLFITGTAVADWSANNRTFQRYGNRSPYKKAAPHGVYRCAGVDNWLAVSCFTEAEWQELARIIGVDPAEPELATLERRLENQDYVDALVERWTSGMDRYEAMELFQQSGVPAGVCQTAGDRCDRDPQLSHLDWLEEVTGTKIGTWPVAELPMKFERTPSYIGGRTKRGAPCYGEDNGLILGTLLNMSEREIEELQAEGVI